MKKVVIGILVLAVLVGGYVFFVGTPSDNSGNITPSRELTQDSPDEYFYEDELGGDEGVETEGYVIETEVDGPDDCTDIEQYDAEHNVCFVECDTPEQCDAMEAKLDAALDELEGDYQDFSKDFKEFAQDNDEAEEKSEVAYRVDKGENFVVVSGNENANDRKIKKWLASISPDKLSDTYLARLVIVTNMGDDTMAYVAPNISNPQKWDVFININSLKDDGDKEMVFTLIHEYAHILTLNSSQATKGTDEESCHNYFIQEGCLNTDAYLNNFYQKFWEGKFNPEAEDADENYSKQPNAFVTDYAATNPAEDIAESFATFVFKKQGGESSIAEQKVNFFYSYPELIKMRDTIRDVLKPFVRKRITQ